MPYAPPLTDDEIAERLRGLDGWARQGDTIRRTVKLKGFRGAIAFVNAIADAAEAANHHPDIAIHDYNRVTLTLTTHAAKGLTFRDFELAATIDRLVPEQASAQPSGGGGSVASG
jgi:4a-hydroxytetrahydrobiopterin dehydratase